jgi:quinol-cytochrome oxidoreductase complex cytochrome b subunit
VVALVSAVAVSVPSLTRRRPKLLELASIATFLVFTVVAFAANPPDDGVLDRYARAIATGTLTVIAIGSLLTVPFTEQYARESTPPEVWDTPSFHNTNRVFTALWAAVFAAMTVSHVIAGAIDTRRAETIFNWVIPIALVVAMFRYMEQYRARLRAEAVNRPGA